MTKTVQTKKTKTVISWAEALSQTLCRLEKNKMVYWREFDPFIDLRLSWRSSTMRHLFHVLPEQTILEIGAGDGGFCRALSQRLRQECDLTAAVFSKEFEPQGKDPRADRVTTLFLDQFPGPLAGQRYDYIVVQNMLEDQTRHDLLREMRKLLKPGGGLLVFEPNPWNPYYRLRKLVRKILPLSWRRPGEPLSLDRLQVFSLLSSAGYTDIQALPHDFLYAPIPRFLQGPAQGLSLILENCPFLRNFAGALYVWARNGDGEAAFARDLCEHDLFFERVSFVVPARNEEVNIDPLLRGLRQFYGKYIQEIIMVDDNSTDATASLIRQAAEQDPRIKLLSRRAPAGVGRALREGIAAAKGDYVVLMDCDFAGIIPEMRDLFQAVADGADVAVGSRFSRESVLLNYPFTKIIANRSFHWIASVLLKKKFRDLSNNLKILTREAANAVEIESDDFAANAETGLKPLLAGSRVEEVPISWFNRSLFMGLSSFKILQTGPNYVRLLYRLVKKEKEQE